MNSSTCTLEGEVLVPGNARGIPIALAPLSFWGGYDAEDGKIIDRTHPNRGQSLQDRILVMPRARGSSSSSSVLAEALRNGTGPAGIILCERDLIIAIGVIAANELYSLDVPVVTVDENAFARIALCTSTLNIDAADTARSASISFGA
ncbi:aconitase X swivel domain-containing protein [Paraburkholderia sp.]|uniref:aconitase X swivel domain-containing protein n=1 Tax=Paraburkholderia sp. TaxID=1926495 RepID=UPI0039E3843D